MKEKYVYKNNKFRDGPLSCIFLRVFNSVQSFQQLLFLVLNLNFNDLRNAAP